MQEIETVLIILVDVLVDAGQLLDELRDSPSVHSCYKALLLVIKTSYEEADVHGLMNTHLRSPSLMHATTQSAISDVSEIFTMAIERGSGNNKKNNQVPIFTSEKVGSVIYGLKVTFQYRYYRRN